MVGISVIEMAIAFLISLAWIVASLWIGPAIGWVDRPDDSDLKVHQRSGPPTSTKAFGPTSLLCNGWASLPKMC